MVDLNAKEAEAQPIAVIFLDIDGVLNDAAHRMSMATNKMVVAWSHEVGLAILDRSRVARMQRLCDETGAAVVIVSGWRQWASAEAIARVLSDAGLRAPVLGTVGKLKPTMDSRAMATADWLADHPEVTRWVVIDDTAFLWNGYEELASRLVVPQDGLTDADVDKARALLSTPASP